jgi:hypothetical protein
MERGADFFANLDVYLVTHLGACRVSHIRWYPENPWAVCPEENGGFGLSFAIHNGTTLYYKAKETE